MKATLKIILGFFAGAILGMTVPYAIALLSLFPFLRGDTPYETIMAYMLFSAMAGAFLGGGIAYRMTSLKNTASK